MKRKLSKIYTPYSLCLLAVFLLFLTERPHSQEITPSLTAPLKVVDGDSLEIGTARIRLIGIDAPEYLQKCKNAKNKEYSCGLEAKAYLEQLIQGKKIRCTSHKKDQYERDLCTCYADDTDINAEMVRSGNAVVYMESPYQTEEKEAQNAKRGLWQGKFIHPYLFRRLNSRLNNLKKSK